MTQTHTAPPCVDNRGRPTARHRLDRALAALHQPLAAGFDTRQALWPLAATSGCPYRGGWRTPPPRGLAGSHRRGLAPSAFRVCRQLLRGPRAARPGRHAGEGSWETTTDRARRPAPGRASPHRQTTTRAAGGGSEPRRHLGRFGGAPGLRGQLCGAAGAALGSGMNAGEPRWSLPQGGPGRGSRSAAWGQAFTDSRSGARTTASEGVLRWCTRPRMPSTSSSAAAAKDTQAAMVAIWPKMENA